MAFLKKIIEKRKASKERNKRSRSIVLYLVFVVISAVMWCIVTFNNNITIDMEIPVTITSRPTNVHYLSTVPDTLTVSLTSKGSSFVKYLFMSAPELKIDFTDYIDGNGSFRIDQAQLKKVIGKLFDGTATVNSVYPGDISVRYTDSPGKKVPVNCDFDIRPAAMYTLVGETKCSTDSVYVYGDAKTLSNITEVYTYHVKEVGLTDTLRRKVKLAHINGALIEPSSIDVVVPIEKMVTKTQKIPISVRNLPKGINVVVFPSKVDATFRVPLSFYKPNSNNITAVVDYNSINLNTPGNKVELKVGEVSGAYKDVQLLLDSVEYIIEKH